jgi:hypothetical protein
MIPMSTSLATNEMNLLIQGDEVPRTKTTKSPVNTAAFPAYRKRAMTKIIDKAELPYLN